MDNLIKIEGLNKLNLETTAVKIMESENEPAIHTYIKVKAIEQIVKFITQNKEFRKKVKDSFLEQTEGVYDKTNILGVTVKPRDTSKQEILKDTYMYSDEIINLENEVESIESDLAFKKDILKQKKLMEINNGTAIKVTVDSILGEEFVESEILKNFDISITFPSGK